MSEYNHRKTRRLPNYNYRSEGIYFVTICIKGSTLLCVINKDDTTLNAHVELTAIGLIIANCIDQIKDHSEGVTVYEWIIMPDHIHFLLQFDHVEPVIEREIIEGSHHSNVSPYSRTLGVVVRQFKAAVTGIVRREGYRDFKWQRNYYDHIVRNEEELQRIRWYICNNPQKLLLAQEEQRKRNSRI